MRNVVPRQGTETGRERPSKILPIEKCSSPTGDGNLISKFSLLSERDQLRNVVPRQGTETMLQEFDSGNMEAIEKCSSPTGDGNK